MVHMTNSLVAALTDDIDDPLVSVVGAGGKKTTLYALAARLERAIVTSTVRIPIFDPHVTSVIETRDPLPALSKIDADDFPVGIVPDQERSNRYLGYSPETVSEIGRAHDGPVLVKADGARTRGLKAPNAREPQIPSGSDVVIPIASAHVVGRPLTDDWVHRPELVAELTALSPGDAITTQAVATVLASPDGGLKNVPTEATPIPMISQVDTADDEAAAREIGDRILEMADVPRVVFSRLDVYDVAE